MKFSPLSLYHWYRRALRNPRYRWLVILGTLAYLISPIDIAPDLVPILGQVDDFAILSIFFSELIGLVWDWFRSADEIETGDRLDRDTDNESANTKTVDVEAVSLD